MLGYTPVDRMTDTCKNIIFPQTWFAGSNKNFEYNTIVYAVHIRDNKGVFGHLTFSSTDGFQVNILTFQKSFRHIY